MARKKLTPTSSGVATNFVGAPANPAEPQRSAPPARITRFGPDTTFGPDTQFGPIKPERL